MCTLTVIIPHHNTPALLQRCLDSIPVREDIQVIVVDDNSDSSLVDFDCFPGIDREGTDVYLTIEGRGAGYARNVGLSHAKGEWLLFADSDDFFTPGFFDSVSSFFNSDADMVLFKANSVDSDTLKQSNRDENINGRIDECLRGNITPKEASIAVQSPWCRLIRREFVEKNKIRFEEVMSSNDTMFTTKATCLASMVLVCPDPIYVVTFRQGSLWNTRRSPKNHLTRLRVLIRRNKYVRKYGFRQLPVHGYIIKSLKISFPTFLKALWITVSQGALFQGIPYYFKKNR